MDAVTGVLFVHSIMEFQRWTQAMEKNHPLSPGTASQLIRQTIWLATFDREVHEVEGRIAMLFPFLRRPDFETMYIAPVLDSARLAIDLPHEVGSSSLTLILEYLRFFQAPGPSDEEIETFFLRFWDFSTPLSLCELLTAARSLDVNPLADITICVLLRMICDMTAEEFSKAFYLPDDLTDWEQQRTLKSPQDLTEKVNREPRNKLINQLVAWKEGSLEENTSRNDEEASIRSSSDAVDEGVDRHDHHRGTQSLDIFLHLIGMEQKEREGNGEEHWKKEWTKSLREDEEAKFLGPPIDLNGSEIGRILSTNSTEHSAQSTLDVWNDQESETSLGTADGDEEHISVVSEPGELDESDRVVDEFYTFRSVNYPWFKPTRQTWAEVVPQMAALASYVHEMNRDNYALPSRESHASSRSHVVQIDNKGVAGDSLEVAVRNDDGDIQVQNNIAEVVATADNREVAVLNDDGELEDVPTQNNNGKVAAAAAAADNRRVEVRKDHEELGAHTDSREVGVQKDHHAEVVAHTGNPKVAAQNYNREVAAAADSQEVHAQNDHEEVAAALNANGEITAQNDGRSEDEVQNDSDTDQSHNDCSQEEILSNCGNSGEDTSQSDYREVEIRAGGSNAEESQQRNFPTETESSLQCNEFWNCCFYPLSFVSLLLLGFLLWGNY